MRSSPKLLLLENFSFLLGQLKAFDDPAITYSSQGMQNVRGGERRIYRSNAHTNPFYTYAESATVNLQSVVDVTFGSTAIECDQWTVSHDTFKDDKLKEKYPKPEPPYTVLITSRDSLKNNTAKRYYVSCSCMDFETTFKEELLKYGYTNGMVVKPGTGKKKLAPAVCKHIFTVLSKEYKDIIALEQGPQESAEIIAKVDIAEPVMPPSMPAIQPKIRHGKAPKTEAQKKAEYEKDIRKALKFFSNAMPNGVEVYKNTRATNAWKQYKFMVAKYFQGWVIVFTNPQLNPMRDKTREKEMVPLLARTGKGMIPTGDAIVVYTKYFNKDELMNMIKTETRPIQQNQIDRVKTLNPKATITEGLELADASLRSLLLEIC